MFQNRRNQRVHGYALLYYYINGCLLQNENGWQKDGLIAPPLCGETAGRKSNLSQGVFRTKYTVVMRRKPFISLGKHFNGTSRRITKPFSRNKQKRNRVIGNRKILNYTCIPTMWARGNMMAGRTRKKTLGCFLLLNVNHYRHQIHPITR
jgi:hypothetical protein